jgi:hypothetical protein
MVTGCGMGGRVSVSGRGRESFIIAISSTPALSPASDWGRRIFFPRRFKTLGEWSQQLARTMSHLDMRYLQPAKYEVINTLRTKLVCFIQGLIVYRAVNSLTFSRLMTCIYVVPHRYPPDVAFYIFIQQIYVLNILNMLHTLRFFLFKMPFISQCYLFWFQYYSHFKYRMC